jgi:hypothetical protein
MNGTNLWEEMRSVHMNGLGSRAIILPIEFARYRQLNPKSKVKVVFSAKSGLLVVVADESEYERKRDLVKKLLEVDQI